jgi:hypothetical protein
MRWQEEVTLNSYEMQWTVRYYLHMSGKWVVPGDSGAGAGANAGAGPHSTTSLSPGAMAYCRRKHVDWQDMMKKADSIFRTTNPAYQSPL